MGRFDHARPLIIDPILNYSTYIGPDAQAHSIAVDSSGEAYVTGGSDPGLVTTAGSLQTTFKDTQLYGTSPFVAKLNSTGTALLYCTYLSGSGNDSAAGIALDAAGDAYVVGTAGSADFPITAGALQKTNRAAGNDDVTAYAGTGFVTELNSTGTALLYSTFLGGSTSAEVARVAVDTSGYAYITGSTEDTDFPTTAGAFQTSTVTKPSGWYSAFVAKLNPTGTALVYSTYLSGTGSDWGNAIATDSTGAAYVGGATESTNFPITSGALQSADHAGISPTGFVSKLNAAGTGLVYSTFLGGSSSSQVNAIALDSSGDVYATGSTTSPDFPVTAGAFQPNIGNTSFGYPQTNAFVTELNSSGRALNYSSFLGGSISLGAYADEGDEATGIAVDGDGLVYVTGASCTEDFPVTEGAFQLQNVAGETSASCMAFLTKLNPAPYTRLLYSTYFGGTGDQNYESSDVATGLAMDSLGNVYVAGYTSSVDFPVTTTVFESPSSATLDTGAFVAEFNGSELQTLAAPTLTVTSSANPVAYGTPVTLTATLRSFSGSNTPTGTVAFSFLQKELSDASQVGMGPWTIEPVNGSGVATFSSPTFMGLQTPVTVHYLGDANNAPATVNYTQVWTPLPTTIHLTSNAASAPYGTPIALTATVLDSNGNVPDGTVVFVLGGTAYAFEGVGPSTGPAVWINGTFAGSASDMLPVGTDSITASFTSSTGTAQASASAPLTETITSLGVTPDPTFTPPAGTYNNDQQVTLSDSNSSAVIYYTTDGSTPGPGLSYQYDSAFPLNVDASQTIKAVAQAPGYAPSNLVSAAYVIDILPPGIAAGPGTSTSITTGQGSVGSGVIYVVGTNGFFGSVTLTCAVTTAMTYYSSMPTCTMSPPQLSISGPTAQSASLQVTTTAPVALNRMRILPWASSAGTTLSLVFFLGGFRRRRAWWTLLGLFVLFASAGVSGCGSGGSGGSYSGGGGGGGAPIYGTTVGAYTVTITGTAGTSSYTLGTVALTVQ